MPTKNKSYSWTRFSRETLREILELAEQNYLEDRAVWEKANPEAAQKIADRDTSNPHLKFSNRFDRPTFGSLMVSDADGSTSFRESEVEDFFRRLGDPYDGYSFSYSKLAQIMPIDCINVSVNVDKTSTQVSVGHSDSRVVDRFMAFMRDAAEANGVSIPEPQPERPRVFIGHGGSGEWQKTERWLRNLGIEVRAYETLPHSGRTIERVLTDVLNWANFALLVMTAEDERADASVQARQNVVHELGLFQGRLGWDQALVLLEAGTTEFSNIAGTNQFRFPAGAIDAKHGDVIVALRERFGSII